MKDLENAMASEIKMCLLYAGILDIINFAQWNSTHGTMG